MKNRVIIVGGGHNGLVAGFYLAKAGLQVAILERRPIVGGCAVTELVDERNAPNDRVSTASYMASMLNPRIIADLDLRARGLQMVTADPAFQVALEDGAVLPWTGNAERMRAVLERFAPEDQDAFFALDRRLKRLASWIQPFILRPPPDLRTRGLIRLRALWPIGKVFYGLGINDLEDLMTFLTTSLAEIVERHLRTERSRRLILANSVYGRHGGPFGERRVQGYTGHVIGGMGAISDAMCLACTAAGARIRLNAPVHQVLLEGNRVRGVVLESGEELPADLVVSNADPKRTFLTLLPTAACDEVFRQDVERIRMNGPCAKVNYVLERAPLLPGVSASASPQERAVFTLVPTLRDAQRSYDAARLGFIPDVLWIDAVLPSVVDTTLTTNGHHVLTCFVQFVPYRLTSSSWEREREPLGDAVTAYIDQRIPGFAKTILARQVLTPLDLEQRFAISEGNIFHGDLSPAQLFLMRPLPGWCRYRTPVRGLYLCGAGTHPGGGVTGAPGYNCAHQILRGES